MTYPAPILVGHSNGGFLAAQHVALHPETPALILLSAHAGGDTAERLAKQTGLLGGSETAAMRAQAEQMIAEGRRDALMLLPGWWYVSTASSYIDRLTTMPDTVAAAPQIKCPVLYIRGDQELKDAYPAEDFAAQCHGHCDVEIIENCDHFYNGREAVITDTVCKWLVRALVASSQEYVSSKTG